ncbi:hypothetical protein CSV75_15940 [Sporosarcina sp. P18a]|nr:hypothetical protein CSV75_15940 [Sporosarcina sp. P18a]
MVDKGYSAYDKAPLVTLVKLYYHINQNIEKGILSKAMHGELDLIKQAAMKRVVPSVTDL